MNLSPWPDWLESIWAKSRVEKGKPGESLARHTQFVLARLSDLAHLRPQLTTYLEVPRLWHCLYWASFLHDFGKAAPGFQAMLRGGGSWGERHEVLSLVFLDWIAPSFSPVEQKWILASIVSHHKDQKEIKLAYDANPELVEEMVESLSEETVRALWRWLNNYASVWIDDLSLSSFGVQAVTVIDEKTAIRMVCREGAERINRWLKTYRRFMQDIQSERNMHVVSTLVMLRGLVTMADHSASAHLSQVPQGIQYHWQTLADRIFAPKDGKDRAAFDPHKHQEESATQHHTSAMLIAPTGSGKTEAALFWATGDGTQATPRIFYTLPYQASMNAMYDRLRSPECFGEEMVGLQHGRALQALHQRLWESESGPQSIVERTKWQIGLNRLHAYPVKVFSPYQMLKAVYQIKGFEGMLADYTQAAFIFDEIHAYDASRLALILALVKHLRLNYDARFFVMSATFPSILRDIMKDVLGIEKPITAEPKLFKDFQRHTLRLLDGELLMEGLPQIIADVQRGRSVLVCCNTVQRAQDMFTLLGSHLAPGQVELIHSRFIMRDRLEREKMIRDRCEVGVEHGGSGFAVVATQVVEVSLNIDLDTIYSDPAPLDALVQRFGRVNRARKKGLVPVHVFREPRDGQHIYLEELVQRTLDVLEEHNNDNIDETTIGIWLDKIYEAPEIAGPWRKAFDDQYKLVTEILSKMRPFNSDEKREEEFEKLFDGVDVLPRCFEQEYLDLLARHEFIEASHFFVNISQRKYYQLACQGKIRPMDDKSRKKWIVLQEYDPIFGLTFDIAAPELNGEY